MAQKFSVGVVIGGMLNSTFNSAMSGAHRALDSLGEVSRRLEARQSALTRATEHYGQIGSRSTLRLNTELSRVGRTMEQLERYQKRLSAAMATSDALKSNRMALYGQGLETYALARAMGSPIISAVKKYASFEAQLRDIGVTGDLDTAQENQIGNIIRQKAKETNQLQETLMEGIGTLVAAGQAPLKAAGMSELLGKTATASGANINDLAKMSLAFESLRIKEGQEMKEAFNRAVFGGKSGRFELKDMAQYLPELAQQFAAKGIYGQEALSQIVASLEVGREGAGTEGEAATNMRNWLASMGRRDIALRYAKAGVDYQASMSQFVSGGKSQYEASILIADRFIKSKGKEFLSQWEKAGANGDREAQQMLMESFGLSSIFTDVQTVNHLLAMRQRWNDYAQIKSDMGGKAAQGSIDTDFGKQNQTLDAKWRRTTISFNESAISLGASLRPALMQLAETFIPIMDSVGKWIAANPQLVSGIVKVVGALLVFKIATIGLKLGLNLLISPFINLWKGATLLRTQFLLLNTAGGVLSRGLMIVGRSVLWIGRALLMNPIGIAITLIAGSAYLIYRNWSAVSKWFKDRWVDIKTAFKGGIGGISKLLINWSPVGLLYKAFAAALKYLGVELPAKFTDFGSHMIDGLVNGIKNKWAVLKSTVSEMGDSVSGWFAEKLGIHSPSRVFMGFGDNIAQGAVIGLQRTTPLAARAGQRLASQMTPDMPRIPSPEIMSAGYAGRRSTEVAGATPASGLQVHFNPQIYLDGKESAAPAGITGALNLSMHELEKMLERLLAQQQRRRYS